MVLLLQITHISIFVLWQKLSFWECFMHVFFLQSLCRNIQDDCNKRSFSFMSHIFSFPCRYPIFFLLKAHADPFLPPLCGMARNDCYAQFIFMHVSHIILFSHSPYSRMLQTHSDARGVSPSPCIIPIFPIPFTIPNTLLILNQAPISLKHNLSHFLN